MRKVLFAVGALAAVALTTVAVAGARGPAGQFASGSAKTDVVVTAGLEHLNFTAHNSGLSFSDCTATGQLHYDSDLFDFTADVTGLVAVPAGMGGGAFIVAQVTKSATMTAPVGATVWFDVVDGGLNPAGTGDTILLEAIFPTGRPPICLGPLVGHPIEQGNIIVKANLP
jgi:hypothetical protein